MESIVPVAPAGLCFTSEKFTKDGFLADPFLQDLWNTVPLEILRDDLGTYLKVLRSAMIELINRDYADFVNLSTCLVGLDGAISNLQGPLSAIHSEILRVEKVLNEEHSKLQLKLSERQAVREKKLVLECLMKIPHCLSHLEGLLEGLTHEGVAAPTVDDHQDPAKGLVMERAANEFNRLQHLLVKCSGTATVALYRERIERVGVDLMKWLEEALIASVEQQRRPVLHKTLRTFVLLDQCQLAEDLVRIRIVQPAVRQLLNERQLKMEPRDLDGLLTKLKDFVRHQLKDLVDVSTSFETPHGFNVVAHCLWPEVCVALVDGLGCIFDSRDPDLLHKRYCCTVEFLEYVARLSADVDAEALTSDANYQRLVNNWNLPVYFQMRFQDIAGDVEASLAAPFRAHDGDRSARPAHLASTAVVCDALLACFSTDVYLTPLAHRFWKLCLQVLARYGAKIGAVLQEHQKRSESTPPASLTSSSSSTRLVDMAEASAPPPATGLAHSASTPRLPSSTSATGQPGLDQLVHLDADIRLILAHLPRVWDAAWKQLQPLTASAEQRLLFQDAFGDATRALEALLPRAGELVVAELSGQCAAHLRHVGDIPRLYRRTNKEAPTKAFAYVHQLLAPLVEFRRRHADAADVHLWTDRVLQTTAKQYLVAVSDVLTSVQKTEESLKRLRKERAATSSASAAAAGVSDDDKIRMQLVVDVDAFVEQSAALLPPPTPTTPTSPHIDALRRVVEPARLVFRRPAPAAAADG